ncbi:hypothetical protein NO1_1313 [Candidatus Termititenax aidoneus]|uniref:SLH domain-containing protein n=1 Tax=Termititenax aidoneus TaxID=2218524 RepID=A0A388TBC5_TERA1|nr:hypothetical protein NO1_1313 [Candidatus Termititenax aidoneus]
MTRLRRAVLFFLLGSFLLADAKDTYNLEPLLIGADAMARGGAYLAAPQSSHYVFQNYAFLGDTSPRLSLSAFKLLNEVNYLDAAYSQANFSLGFLTVQENGGYLRTAANQLAGGRIGFQDTTIYGAYGASFDAFGLGARLKYRQKYFSGFSANASGTALDLAGFYKLNSFWSFGTELNNIVATPLDWSDGEREKFLPEYGLGLRFHPFTHVDFYTDVNLVENTSFWHIGTDYWLGQNMVLRCGFEEAYDLQYETETKHFKFTAGLGFNLWGFYFDYAYNPGDDMAENFTHFFTLSYRFPERVKKIPPRPVVEKPAPPQNRQRFFRDIGYLSVAEQLAIENLAAAGILPRANPYFAPQRIMSRAEFFTILLNLLDKEGRVPREEIKHFSDSTKLADRASSYGLLSGYADGFARLHLPMRRDEAAGAVTRYAEISGLDLLDTLRYRDVPRRHWGYQDINLTREKNMTYGVGRDLFEPKSYLTRRDAARILSRLRYAQELTRGLPPIEGLQ